MSHQKDLIGQYLEQIGRVALLNREQELKLAYQVAEWVKLKQLLHEAVLKGDKQLQDYENLLNLKTELRKRGQIPSQQKWAQAANLEPSELSQIIALGKERWATIASVNVRELEKCLVTGRKAKRQLIEANLRLVVAIAKKYHRKPMDLLDLIQEGNLALSKAIEKFDPTLGYKLSTFAYWQIRKAITGALPDLWPGALSSSQLSVAKFAPTSSNSAAIKTRKRTRSNL